MGGPPRPEATYKTECIVSSEAGIQLAGREAVIHMTVLKDDVSYFVVGRKYVASFSAAAPEHLDGGAGAGASGS